MQARDVDLTENVDLNRNITLTMQGGCDSGFGIGTGTGFTSLHGNLTVSRGSLVIDRVIITGLLQGGSGGSGAGI
jgi:hypothetical protein